MTIGWYPYNDRWRRAAFHVKYVCRNLDDTRNVDRTYTICGQLDLRHDRLLTYYEKLETHAGNSTYFDYIMAHF